jgi:2-dehydro-3-deoxygalactonokinase
MDSMKQPDWVAIDWGTSNLRIWGMSDSGELLQEFCSEVGMSRLSPDQYESVLVDAISGWLIDRVRPLTILICGSATNRQGWREVPYVETPCEPMGSRIRIETNDPMVEVYLLGGVSQSSPAAVMRGEEIQLLGAISSGISEGLFCLPGTHSKWVEVQQNKIVDFTTFLTGESFELYSQFSILKHSVQADEINYEQFETAVKEIFYEPQKFTALLFSLRADDLLHSQKSLLARSKLSGYLIGIELAGAAARWKNKRVALIGSSSLTAIYYRALISVGGVADCLNGDKLAREGLFIHYQEVKRV